MMRAFFSQVIRVNGIPALPRKWRMPILAAGMATALCLTVLAGQAWAQRDARVLQRNLAELVSDSYTIVVGRITNVRSEVHPQIPDLHTIVVTMQVSEVWKGQAGAQFTFRAFVNNELDYKEKLGYGDGQEVLLMLTQPSQYGLSSPAGLEQGRFRIQSDAKGNRSLANSLNNAGLFNRISKTAPKLDEQLTGLPARQLLTTQKSGPINFDDFRTIVKTLVANSQP
jgi:hypothetical protein